jgi:hypothetical protein
MEGIDRASFFFGCVYGAFAASIIAIMLRNYLEAQLYSTFKKRNLNRFPDATQPTLTPAGIVESSGAARLRMIMWVFFLVIFGVTAVVGLFYILAG